MAYQFTAEYQSLIVASILQDPTLLAGIRDAISPEYFTNASEAEIIRIVVEFYDHYRSRPLRDTVLQLAYDRANRLGWRESDRDKLIGEIYRIYSIPLQEADIQRVKDQVAQFGRIQALKIAMLDSIHVIEDFEKGEQVKLESVETKIERALIVGAAKNMGISLVEVMPDMAKLCTSHDLAAKDRRVATGFPTIDKYLNGGLGGGELGFVLAPSNKGKSMLLCCMAAAAFRQGKKTVYFTFEMKEPEVASRIAANITDIEISRVQANDPAYTKKVQELSFVLQNRNLRIIYIKPSEATANNLRSILMTIGSIEGWTPEIILVDYMDEMTNPGSSRGGEDDMYNNYGKIASDLLSLGVDYKCPLWTASQVNREGYETTKLSTTGRSMQKIDKAEFVFTPTQSESEARENKMNLVIQKNRRGPGVGAKIKCSANLAKAKINEITA